MRRADVACGRLGALTDPYWQSMIAGFMHQPAALTPAGRDETDAGEKGWVVWRGRAEEPDENICTGASARAEGRVQR